jgi:hypothetical protein
VWPNKKSRIMGRFALTLQHSVLFISWLPYSPGTINPVCSLTLLGSCWHMPCVRFTQPQVYLEYPWCFGSATQVTMSDHAMPWPLAMSPMLRPFLVPAHATMPACMSTLGWTVCVLFQMQARCWDLKSRSQCAIRAGSIVCSVKSAEVGVIQSTSVLVGSSASVSYCECEF